MGAKLCGAKDPGSLSAAADRSSRPDESRAAENHRRFELLISQRDCKLDARGTTCRYVTGENARAKQDCRGRAEGCDNLPPSLGTANQQSTLGNLYFQADQVSGDYGTPSWSLPLRIVERELNL